MSFSLRPKLRLAAVPDKSNTVTEPNNTRVQQKGLSIIQGYTIRKDKLNLIYIFDLQFFKICALFLAQGFLTWPSVHYKVESESNFEMTIHSVD